MTINAKQNEGCATGERILGMDIGGAHIKYVLAEAARGQRLNLVEANSQTFALWEAPEKLATQLGDLLIALTGAEESGESRLGIDRILVTMTGELCDCFSDRKAGVQFILQAVEQAVDQFVSVVGEDRRPAVSVWQVEAGFVSIEDAREQPLTVASANWHAQACAVAKMFENDHCVLIDVGSTTTDITILAKGQPVLMGCNDFERMQSGALVYTGAKRTPLMSFSKMMREEYWGIASECFATMEDVNVLLGNMPERAGRESQAFDTCDGKPMTKQYAASRVLRMFGSDLSSHTVEDAKRMAKEFLLTQGRWIASEIDRVSSRCDVEMERIVVSGSGSFMARTSAAVALPGKEIVSLDDYLSPQESESACAWAMVFLWSKQ
jgi:(4-(4-[2-(gamma-L-glutamylamino)ethyl]phenoxymethyl)furan-2-yl)methanamine synthase